MESTLQAELLNQHIDAFESIKSLPEENGSMLYNFLIAARNYFESFLEKLYPERVSELTTLNYQAKTQIPLTKSVYWIAGFCFREL